MVFEEPIQLSDKTAATHFECFRHLLPLPRHLGCKSIVIHAYCYDGALASACGRLHKQHHAAYFDSLRRSGMHEGDRILLECMNWVVVVTCVNHLGHNSLKWALAEYTSDKLCTKNCFIAVESLRNSFGQLVACLEHWIRSKIAFGGWAFDEQYQLWTALGVDVEWIDQLMVLQLRWDRDQLKVATRFANQDSVVSAVATVFLHIMSLKIYSDSRWVSLGPSCRTLLCGMCVGLERLVEYVSNTPGQSTYYVGGFSRLDSQVKRMVAVASVCSYLPDAVLALLWECDQLPKMLPRLRQEISDEIAFITNLAQSVYDFLSTAVSYVGNLRSDCVSAALVAVGHINEGFRVADTLPWTLCAYDVDAQLDALFRGPVPTDETAVKIYELLHLGASRQLVKYGLSLLSQISWSATATEQAHVAASSIMKQHRLYGENTMRMRALLLQLRPVLNPDAEATKLAKPRTRLDVLDRKRPDHVGARHIWVQDLVALGARKRKRHAANMPKDFSNKNHREEQRNLGSSP